MPFKITSLSLGLPFNLGTINVEVGEAERRAAWNLYVELATRIATQPLASDAASVREALNSIHALFAISRDLLKEAGPDIGGDQDALGPSVITFLNEGLRPFLEHWHTAYSAHESAETLRLMIEHGLRSVPPELIDQDRWAQRDEFFAALEERRQGLCDFVTVLAKICGVEKPARGETRTRRR